MIDDINRVIEGERVILHNPRMSELWYRASLYKDENTMAFTDSCKHEIEDWSKKNQQEINEWYVMHNTSMSNFYSYIVDKESKTPVGEVAIYYHEDFEKYLVHIVVEAKYRNQGFGTEALTVLLEYVFKVMNLDAIYEIREPNRTEVKSLFSKLGFVVYEEDLRLLSLTKRDYNSKK